ncbi:MAG: hypothetical protein GKR90_26870 [Pseudomonadales bacterium]|nr:hypothetical protein [Pseudomonadales bacterium]
MNRFAEGEETHQQEIRDSSGVLKLNRVPIFLVTGVLSVVALALVFAINTRTQKNQKEEGSSDIEVSEIVEARPSEMAVLNELVAPYQDDDVEIQANLVTPEPEPETAQQPISNISPGFVERIEDPNELERRELIRRLERERFDQMRDAVLSGTQVAVNYRGAEQKDSGSIMDNTIGDIEQAYQDRLSGVLGAASAAGGTPTGAINQELIDPNLRQRKDEFRTNTSRIGYSAHTVMPAISPNELKAGTVIPAVLVSGINSDLPGMIVAQVRRDVRNTLDGTFIVIPQGTKILGRYDNHIALGQSRALVVWDRLQYPDGSTLALEQAPGTDLSGYSGLSDQVDNHYIKIFGNATLLSIIGAGAQRSQGVSGDGERLSATDQLAAELGRQWGEVGRALVERNMQIQPTIKIRPGYRFSVLVNKDILF